MISILKIFIKTKETFNFLNEKYEDVLETNSDLIFLLLGAFYGFESFYRDLGHLNNFNWRGGIIVYFIISISSGALINLLFGRYILTYILYGLSKLLKGRGEVIDIRTVAAYSMLPTILRFPIILYLGLSDKFNALVGAEYWIINSYYFILWIWTLKIMVQGIMLNNKFGFVKSLLTVSPIIILGLGLYFINHIYRFTN